jgi:hypothetical protein
LNVEFNKRIYKLKVLKTEPARAVASVRADVICEFATPLSEFNHDWNRSDTDSSDNEYALKTEVGRTLTGGVIKEKPKPLRSTYAEREKERRQRRNVAGVTRIQDGKEILPPRPKEGKNSSKKKNDAFTGEARFLKKMKRSESEEGDGSMGKKKEPAPPVAPVTQPVTRSGASEPTKRSEFVGVARTLKGATIAPVKEEVKQTVAPPPPPAPVVEEKKKVEAPAKPNLFQGTARTLKGPKP